MNIDLHSHSYYSDGVLSPAELVARAVSKGVTVLALTDHDTVAGIPEALVAAEGAGLRLIPGVELSCTWNHKTIHILGLNIDPQHKGIQTVVADLKRKREARAAQMVNKLIAFGIPGVEESIRQQVKGVPGRSHFAKLLIQKGYAKNHNSAFKRFLVKNKPGYVPTQWLSIAEAVEVIRGAGGIAAIAHPRRYNMTMTKLSEMIEEFAVLGGQAIELATSAQKKDDQLLLYPLLKKHQLYASIGSDFHEPCAYNELGKAFFAISPEHVVWDIFS